MTLDEAIKHCKEIAEKPCHSEDEKECHAEHRQLAYWLKELKYLREIIGIKVYIEGKNDEYDTYFKQNCEKSTK